jgi:hypothetical protein
VTKASLSASGMNCVHSTKVTEPKGEVTLQSGRRYFIVQSERTEMKPLPINPNVVSPIVTLEIRTISANTAGAKDAAQIARNSQVAGVKLEPATIAALAGGRGS